MRAIIADVRARGDAAVRDLDRALRRLRPRRRSGSLPTELRAALDAAAPELRAALEVAAARIREYHAAQLDGARAHARPRRRDAPRAHGAGRPGRALRARRPGRVPVDGADDRDPRRSSPAWPSWCCASRPPPTAACPRRRSPPRPSPGSTEVYRVGGAQAIAAIAYGTETIRPVDVIVGPGNRYVALAKREVGGHGRHRLVRRSVRGRRRRRRQRAGRVRRRRPARAGRARPRRLGRPRHVGPDVADAVDAALDDLLADAPRARRDQVDPRRPAAASCSSTTPSPPLDAVNVIAPEHLELLTADPDVARAARAQRRRGVRRPVGARRARRLRRRASTTCCPPARTARFASALRVDDFRKHVHVVEATEAGLAALAPHLRGARRRPRGSTRTRARSTSAPSRGALVTAGHARDSTVAPRDDLRALEGYHSPQLDVSVRLNTNESPFAAAGRVRRPLGRGARGTPRCNRYPDRAATRAARRARRATSGSRASGSSAPTAPTRCCRRCCSPTAAPAGAPRCSSPPTRCTRTSPASPAPRWSWGSAAPTSPSIPTTPGR